MCGTTPPHMKNKVTVPPGSLSGYLHLPDEIFTVYEEAKVNFGRDSAYDYLKKEILTRADEAVAAMLRDRPITPKRPFREVFAPFVAKLPQLGYVLGGLIGSYMAFLLISGLVRYFQDLGEATAKKATAMGLSHLKENNVWTPMGGQLKGYSFKDVRVVDAKPDDTTNMGSDVFASVLDPIDKKPGDPSHILLSFYDEDLKPVDTFNADVTSYGPGVVSLQFHNTPMHYTKPEYVTLFASPSTSVFGK
jgi:hypothetical protein